jgi:2-desacetyl-2-hydroxyethyl bacteriochlorophyllide A dehydrogenase
MQEQTMKAAVLKEIGKRIEIEQIPIPIPGDGEILVETKACGICGTDLHMIDGWGYTPELPFIMGHEPAGIVRKLGPNVCGFEAGDRVVANIFLTCGSCFYCRTNRETQCTSLNGILGVLKHNGGYGNYFTIPSRQLFYLPDSVPFTEGAIIADAVVTAVHAVKQARIKPLENVVVVSAGGIGSSIIQICKAYGAHVMVIVRSEIKKKRAFAMGADEVFNSQKIDAAMTIKAKGERRGADCVFDCVGNEETLQLSISSLANGGRLVIVGYTQERLHLDPRQVAVHEIEIIGSRSGGKQDTVEAIEFVRNETWRPIVSDLFPIENVNNALKYLREGKALGRIVLTYD